MKTAELTGALLDLWVAKAEGVNAVLWANEGPADNAECVLAERRPNAYPAFFRPSTDWAQGGPLIEKYSIVEIQKDHYDVWSVVSTYGSGQLCIEAQGATPLVAICRAVVRSVYGDEVPE